MIQELYIKNIALIGELSLSFKEGFNILTGETGAGKSIIVDSMNLIIGSRGDKELIKHGEERAFVEAQLSLPSSCSIESLLEEYGIQGESLIVSRELSVTGKNVCRINGRLVNLNVLRDVVSRLVNVYGQNQHQQLMDDRYHLSILDQYAGMKVEEAKADLQKVYGEYAALKRKLDGFEKGLAEKERTMDMLRYQIEEIEKAGLRDGEEEELAQEKNMMLYAEKIATALETSKEHLNGSEGILPRLSGVLKSLESIHHLKEKYEQLFDIVSNAYYSLEDVYYELSASSEDVVFNPGRLDAIEDRLAHLSGLKRKYGATIKEVLQYWEDAQQRYDGLAESDAHTDELKKELKALETEMISCSDALTTIRKGFAVRLERELVAQLQELGMKDAQFRVSFKKKDFSPDGQEDVSFLITVNKGEPLRHLSKVASGGEASRIMLALKNIVAEKEAATTMIFDEIDTGISGNMAHIVARKIANISRSRQVICVTHLPQIAAMADGHFLISKSSDGSRTHTTVGEITGKEIIREIARLSGGMESALSLAHAEELLQNAKEIKRKIM